MMRCFLAKHLGLLLLWSIFANALHAQTARERSVEISVEQPVDGTGLIFHWTADATADQYLIYKKSLEALDWGTPILTLDGMATSFSDPTVLPGEAFEYAVFKKRYAVLRDTICVPSGASLNFTIQDMYGIGLCCNFGFGYYQLNLCGAQVAYGDNFGFVDSTDFEVCDMGNDCESLIINLAPDLFPNSSSWTLTNRADGSILASSGEVGTFISERSEYGFIYAGIEKPAIEQRGSILLLVETQINTALEEELQRLERDLIGEGWQVLRQTAMVDESVTAVRERIQALYETHPTLNTLLIIGHVPVPYSGDIYPDTHSENHQGAWAADPYYGELNGQWTDEVANISTAFFERNHNIPGDGRFDQDSIPSLMELAVGRVDFYNLPAFELDEVELTRRYLDKNHRFRTGQLAVARRALVDDNFGVAFGAPAASAWRNFAPMLGAEQIIEADYFSTLRDSSYLWSYGCGSGSHVSAEGIGTTQDFATDSLQSVFTMLFGSQFGDWDNENNFLRAPLASGLTLSNCWAGNPPWTFHHMALGHTLGYSTLRTQNSQNEVYLNGPQLVHTALLGDPSLTMFVVSPPDDFTAVAQNNSISLNWSAAADDLVVGYYLYRTSDLNLPFERVHTGVLTTTSFIDEPASAGNYWYLLRAVKLEQTGSGSFYNLSTGRLAATDFVLNLTEPISMDALFHLQPNPARGEVMLRHPEDLGTFQLRIYQTNGQLVRQVALQAGREGKTPVSLPALPNGVYWLELNDTKYHWTQRLVIQ
ncbi:MAG: T9SS type A sorting domain-containing protein [Bacteroidota bacterium]